MSISRTSVSSDRQHKMSTRTGKGPKKVLLAPSKREKDSSAEAGTVTPVTDRGLDFDTLREQRTLFVPEDVGKTTPKMEEELGRFILRIFHADPDEADSHPAIKALAFDWIRKWKQFRTLDRNDIDGLTLEGSHRRVDLSQRYK